MRTYADVCGRMLTHGEMVTVEVANKTKALSARSYLLAGNLHRRSQKPVEDYGVAPEERVSP